MKTKILTLSLFVLLAVVSAFPQSTLTRRCPGLAPSPANATVTISKAGAVTIVACTGQAVTITGSGGSGLSGTGTANFVPRFTAGSVLGNTPISWDGTSYVWNTTPLTGAWRMNLTPASTSGSWDVGNAAGAGDNFLSLVKATNTFNAISTNFNLQDSLLSYGLTSSTTTHTATWGDLTTASFPFIALQSSNAININPNGTGTTSIGTGASRIRTDGSTDALSTTLQTFDLSDALGGTFGVSTFKLLRTNTTAGTTGAQTINKPNGSVNFAAGTASIVVTNSTVLATSNINALAQANDATCTVKNVVPAAGSFTITMSANCTAETRVAFWVWN